MKRILTGLFALLIVTGLCVGGFSLCVSASGETSSPSVAVTAEQAGASDQETEMPFGERLSQAGMVTLEGIGMVFAVLAILWGAIEIFRVIMQRSEKKKTVATAVPTPVVPAEPAAESASAESDDGELVSAITAAVAAYLATEEGGAYTGGFRVVSFRRTGNGSAWNKK